MRKKSRQLIDCHRWFMSILPYISTSASNWQNVNHNSLFGQTWCQTEPESNLSQITACDANVTHSEAMRRAEKPLTAEDTHTLESRV